MSREGKIRVRPKGSLNFENVSLGGKYRSTFKSEYKNAFAQSKETRHADIFTPAYDTYKFKPDKNVSFREDFPQKRGSSPSRIDGYKTYYDAMKK